MSNTVEPVSVCKYCANGSVKEDAGERLDRNVKVTTRPAGVAVSRIDRSTFIQPLPQATEPMKPDSRSIIGQLGAAPG